MASSRRMRRVQNAGTFELDLPPEQAFPLFTAEGERRWVPGWTPTILGSGPQHPGQIFLTDMNGQETIWTIIESDSAAFRHLYSRVTPGFSAGTVEVRVRPGSHGSIVDVAYDLTALSEDGAVGLDAYVGAQFEAMLSKWHALITDMLSRTA